jgi:hypothetical protein
MKTSQEQDRVQTPDGPQRLLLRQFVRWDAARETEARGRRDGRQRRE